MVTVVEMGESLVLRESMGRKFVVGIGVGADL